MAPSQDSPQSTQNAESSTAERLTQAVAEKPASQLDEIESQKQSQAAFDQPVLTLYDSLRLRIYDRLRLYYNESQECTTQKITTASQPTEASEVASQPTTQPAEPVGSQAESQVVASQAES